MKTAILIPCYNEAQSIASTVADYRAALPDADVFVYDNNSTDNTAEIARAAGAEVRLERRQGKGAVIRSMFAEIDADVYIMTDGDDTYPAEKAAEMVSLVASGQADMVIGDRLSGAYFTENKRAFHNAGNKTVRGFVNKIFKSDINDIMTGARAFSRRFVKTFPIMSSGFEIETEMTIHALERRLKIVEIPVPYRDRAEGSVSKLNTFSDGIKVLKTIFSLFRDCRPLMFFGLIALVFALAGGLIALPAFVQYFVNVGHYVTSVPSLVFGGFVELAALLSLSVGLTLDVLRRQHAQTMELWIIERRAPRG